jgi:tRNA dimethylallyltransferase
MQKILVILGPTASGKSALAVTLAHTFNGEIISADSRQVYKGLDIGTGKITKKEMDGISHHLLDSVSPKKIFTVQDFKNKAEIAIEEILQKNKLPIICGGTGFYIQALVDNILYPQIPPNILLRKKLEKKSAQELFEMLRKLDSERAENIDSKNPRRLIRAIEIAITLGKVPKVRSQKKYTALQIGIQTDNTILKQSIHKRLIVRIKKGMIEEARKLHAQGMSWERMEQLGLEYRYMARYLQNKKPFDSTQGKQEMIQELENQIWQYAKRQKTWFKKDQRIKWFKVNEIKIIEKEIREFLK